MRRVILSASACALGLALGPLGSADAATFRLRIATGHPPAVVYAGQMKEYFQVELKKRVEAKTKHKIEWVEGYGGSIVKVYETLGGVRFTFSCANLTPVVSWVLEWGPHARVVAPDELRAQVIGELDRARALYSSAG